MGERQELQQESRHKPRQECRSQDTAGSASSDAAEQQDARVAQARRIVDACYGDVLAYCTRHAPAGVDPRDLTQEAFLRLVRAGRYVEQGKPLAYLLTIARNLCIDAGRKGRAEAAPLDFEVADTRDHMADLELALALEALDPQLREIVELRFDQGLSVSEVAQVLGISRFTASRRLRRALAELRGLLSDESTAQAPRGPAAQASTRPAEGPTAPCHADSIQKKGRHRP